MTYSLAADIGVPYLGVELHDGGLEGVHVRDLNVDGVGASRVGSIWRGGKGAFEVHQVALVDGGGIDARVVLVLVDVVELFGDPPLPRTRHLAMGCDASEARRGEGWGGEAI